MYRRANPQVPRACARARARVHSPRDRISPVRERERRRPSRKFRDKLWQFFIPSSFFFFFSLFLSTRHVKREVWFVTVRSWTIFSPEKKKEQVEEEE